MLHSLVKKLLGYYVFYIGPWYSIFIDDMFSLFLTYFISRNPLNDPFFHLLNLQYFQIVVYFQIGTPFNLLIAFFMICLLINNSEPIPLALQMYNLFSPIFQRFLFICQYIPLDWFSSSAKNFIEFIDR